MEKNRLDKCGEPVNAYDLSKVGGSTKSYRQLLEEAKYNPRLYDLVFQAQLREARTRERRTPDNNANN
jgi:hypothetical protein